MYVDTGVTGPRRVCPNRPEHGVWMINGTRCKWAGEIELNGQPLPHAVRRQGEYIYKLSGDGDGCESRRAALPEPPAVTPVAKQVKRASERETSHGPTQTCPVSGSGPRFKTRSPRGLKRVQNGPNGHKTGPNGASKRRTPFEQAETGRNGPKRAQTGRFKRNGLFGARLEPVWARRLERFLAEQCNQGPGGPKVKVGPL